MVNSESAMTEIILNMCVFNEGRSLQRSKTAAKRYCDFLQARSVSDQRDFGSGDLARKTSVDCVTDKYSKEDLV